MQMFVVSAACLLLDPSSLLHNISNMCCLGSAWLLDQAAKSSTFGTIEAANKLLMKDTWYPGFMLTA